MTLLENDNEPTYDPLSIQEFISVLEQLSNKSASLLRVIFFFSPHLKGIFKGTYFEGWDVMKRF